MGKAHTIDYETTLIEDLAADPAEAAGYLSAALEDEDPRVFLVALRHVAQAYGGVGRVAESTGLNRESLYRMLSEHGNPSIASLSTLLSEFGLKLEVGVKPVKRRRKPAPKRSKAS